MQETITYSTSNMKLAAYLNIRFKLLEVVKLNGKIWFHFPMTADIEQEANNYFTAHPSTYVAPLIYTNSLKAIRDEMYQLLDEEKEQEVAS